MSERIVGRGVVRASVDGVGATRLGPGGDAEMHLPMRAVTKKRKGNVQGDGSERFRRR